MKNYYLFIDASVDPESKTGIGVHLLLKEEEIDSFSSELILGRINFKKFTSTSSTRLEIENLLYSLNEIEKIIDKDEINLIVYSDSQNIISLPGRREKLEQKKFLSVRKNEELKNADLYKEFFKITDRLNYSFMKIAGHKKNSYKNKMDQIFSLVDKAARKALRKLIEA